MSDETADDLGIKILEDIENPYGSTVQEKKEPITPVLEIVTPENWSQYFPDTPLTPDTQKELSDGLRYLKVAIDPETGAKAGTVEVRHQHGNNLIVDVEKDYHRRGVASALIKQSQADHENLSLVNFAGPAGENLYTKMGFKPDQGVDRFVWKKEADRGGVIEKT